MHKTNLKHLIVSTVMVVVGVSHTAPEYTHAMWWSVLKHWVWDTLK